MLDFASSPATQYFKGHAITLDGELDYDVTTDRLTGNEVTLYVLFDFALGNLNLSICESENDNELSRSVRRNYPDAETAIRAIDKKYPGKIDMETLLVNVRCFFESLYRSYLSSGTVSEETGYCSRCNTRDINEFSFLFVPAVPDSPHDKASLNLSWAYGCYGGEAIGGEFDEVRKLALEMLYRMRKYADKKGKSEINKIIRIIKDAHEYPSVYVLYPPPID